ncbi:MAG: site-specific integrase, partial [Rhodopirellula sp.]|nr:site-specific integrase [Rhodopirellula sp.]
MTIRRGKRKGEAVAVLREETRRRLETLEWERALIYKTLVLTGLRKSELASLTAAQLVLEADPAYVVLDAADEKSREGSTLPLRHDLAADLQEWLAAKAALVGSEPGTVPLDPVRKGLPADTPLFTVPAGLVRILDRDLKRAGIPKRDDRGRTVDVHAMRHTFGRLLSKGGVAPRTAQAAMRHSTIDLTMNTYTDPRLLDVAGAMDALPSLPLAGGPQGEGIAVKATGTDDSTASRFAPKFAPTIGKRCILESIPVETGEEPDTTAA